MDTFEEFLKRVITIAFWVLLLGPIIILPIILLVLPPLGVQVEVANRLLTALIDPFAMLRLVDSLGIGPSSLFFKIAVFPGFTFAALFSTAVILYERKLLAKMQNRVGPQYAGKFEGILQPIAELFKLMFKEILTPERTDKPFFWAVPFLAIAVGGALLALIPLSPEIYIAKSEIGLVIIFAILSFTPLIVLIAGWASANKFSFIGGLRALHLLISYEIPLILSALGVVMLSGSLDLMKIVQAQANIWFIVPQFVGAGVFFVTMLAELERIPFDLAEADSEIVAGWYTEYSGMHFGALQLANYIKLYGLTLLFTLLFLGGWNGPAILPPLVWLFIKLFIVISFVLALRGTNTRVRIDQLIKLGWVYLIFLAFANLFIALTVASLGIV
ncbi:MAG: NADH-quinone oxidoreductase subunit NuoH [Thaumarchaeota archaeon]|nr:NADH-quinone oxidoreductase subunit NuoH [Nitrososphaerota archaeon]